MAGASTLESREAARETDEVQPPPARKLTQKAYLNAVASVLDDVAKLGVSLLITPFLLAGLGSTLFGVWQILGRLVLYLSAADGRPGQALRWVITNGQAVDDPEEKRRYVGRALGVWLVFLPLIAAVGALLAWFAPLIARVPPPVYGTVRIACGILVFNFLLTGLVALPEAVLHGMNMRYRRMGLLAGMSAVGGVLTVAAVAGGLGLIGVAAAQVLLTGLTGILLWLTVKKYVPWFGVARARFAEVRSFMGLSLWYLAWALISKVLTASDVILLGMLLSAAAVTPYTLTGFAAQSLGGVLSVLLGAVLPGLGGVIGAKEYGKAAALRSEMLTLTWVLVTGMGAAILLCNRPFVSLWVGPQNYAGLWVNLLMVLITMQTVFFRNDGGIIDTTLNVRTKVFLGAGAALLSIGLAVLLTPRMGLAGLCLGFLIARMLLTVSYPLIVASLLNSTRSVRPSGLLRPGLVMLILFAAAAYLGDRLVIDNWLAWVVCAAGGFALFLTTAFMAGLTAAQREQLLRRVRRVRPLAGV